MKYIIATLLKEFEQGRMTRRQLIQRVALTVTPVCVAAAPLSAADGEGFHATDVNHLSYSVPDYARTRDFYADLFGMQIRGDNGSQCALSAGGTSLIVRQGDRAAAIDHFAITIDHWDGAAVGEELRRRGLEPTPDGETSFHVKDPDGFDLQISGRRQQR